MEDLEQPKIKAINVAVLKERPLQSIFQTTVKAQNHETFTTFFVATGQSENLLAKQKVLNLLRVETNKSLFFKVLICLKALTYNYTLINP